MIIFDIEADGLVHDVNSIHCIVLYNTEDGTTTEYNDVGNTEPIVRAITALEEADRIVGHNIINYDLRVISKLYPFFSPVGDVIDTLLLSRLYHPNLMEIDKKHTWKGMPLKLYGRHSLESYGYRLGEYKGDFGKETDWSKWSQEMQDYCKQDVVVTTKICNHFQPYLSGSR
jgi:hypothetical protein